MFVFLLTIKNYPYRRDFTAIKVYSFIEMHVVHFEINISSKGNAANCKSFVDNYYIIYGSSPEGAPVLLLGFTIYW